MAAYDNRIGRAYAGMIGNSRPGDGVTGIVEDAGGIGFGVAVFQGTGDKGITKTPSAKFVGITAADITLVHKAPNVDTYIKGENAGVRNGGTIWVVNGAAAVKPRDPVYITPAGAFTNDDDAANFRANAATFDTTAAPGALVRISLSR